MDINLFRQYLQIAKELGVTRFKIDGETLSADLIQVVAPIKLEDLAREMPSDEKLLGIEEPESVNLGDK